MVPPAPVPIPVPAPTVPPTGGGHPIPTGPHAPVVPTPIPIPAPVAPTIPPTAPPVGPPAPVPIPVPAPTGGTGSGRPTPATPHAPVIPASPSPLFPTFPTAPSTGPLTGGGTPTPTSPPPTRPRNVGAFFGAARRAARGLPLVEEEEGATPPIASVPTPRPVRIPYAYDPSSPSFPIEGDQLLAGEEEEEIPGSNPAGVRTSRQGNHIPAHAAPSRQAEAAAVSPEVGTASPEPFIRRLGVRGRPLGLRPDPGDDGGDTSPDGGPPVDPNPGNGNPSTPGGQTPGSEPDADEESNREGTTPPARELLPWERKVQDGTYSWD